jgi:P27 family predicted phage terminase small subunit
MPKGEKPKPAAIKIAEGNRRKVAKAELKEDPRGIGSPRLPGRLTEVEQQLFLDIVASLPVGLLSRADESALEAYAVEWATFRESDTKIKASGLLIQTPQGPIRNPLLAVRNNSVKAMTSIGSNIGLSPVARARLAAPGAGADDPMELLLGMDGDPAGAWSTLPRTKQ